jgi:pimeloyl-ACP methyl ester carboxylesterase
MAVEKANQQIKLADGRKLGYAEYGDPTGVPILFFHGGNDSRLEGALLHETAERLNVHLIAPDRPGYGLSDFQPGRGFLDWPADITEMVEALGIDRFAVMGHSGGGPHVAAVAYQMPEGLTATALISSAAPPGSTNEGMALMFRVVNFLMGFAPPLNRLMNQQTANQLSDPDKFFAQWGKMSKADGKLFETNPEVKIKIVAEMREAYRQGVDHIVHEHELFKQTWGFPLEEISKTVQIWHGLADPQSSPAWSRYLAERIPDNRTHFIPNEGHFSILVNHQEDIINGVLDQ